MFFLSLSLKYIKGDSFIYRYIKHTKNPWESLDTLNINFYFILNLLVISGDIKLPARVQEAMQMQVEAERKKRAAILESEGMRAAEINVAEGKRTSRILASGT